jgi:transcriptional regulator with XRE-family HTH domain
MPTKWNETSGLSGEPLEGIGWMTEGLGTHLWNLRTSRQWTLGQLAKQAGVSKSALSQWETGKRQPRIPELESVLNALDASPAQRVLLLTQIEAPRALRHLRQSEIGMALGAPPLSGDLLRALRLRKGWTQGEVAHELGVHRTTITLWERGERLPSTAQLHALCFALEAREEEMVMLTVGTFAEAPQEEESLSWEAKALRLHNRMTDFRSSNIHGTWELLFLSLEREAWLLATQHERAIPVLTSVLVHHAEQQCRHQLWAEAGTLSRRAISLIPRYPTDEDTRLRAVLMQAAAAVYEGHSLAPERGLMLLKSHVSTSSLPAFTAWILRDMAQYALLAGQPEVGLALAKQAVGIAKQCDNPAERLLRQIDFGEMLIAVGKPEAALEQLALPSEEWGAFAARAETARANAFLALSPD